jgi:hypothetical protein
MILEPSLFVYLAVAFALGEAGACVVAGWRWLAGILVESCCDGAVSVGRYHGAREGRVPGPDRLGGKSKSGGKKEDLQTQRQLSWKGIGVERGCVWGGNLGVGRFVDIRPAVGVWAGALGQHPARARWSRREGGVYSHVERRESNDLTTGKGRARGERCGQGRRQLTMGGGWEVIGI